MSRPPAESPAHAPQWMVDATVQAHGGLTWERKFSGRRFERLVDVALSATPDGTIKLIFGILEQRAVIHGELHATVELVCQRCMGAMQYPLDETFDLMLVESEVEAAAVPESHEPWLANATHLDVHELVEEQLLLALPLIPRHADEASCLKAAPQLQSLLDQAPITDVETPATPDGEVQRPFSQLRDLLRKQ